MLTRQPPRRLHRLTGSTDDLTAIVDAGPEAFDAAAVSRLLSGITDVVGAITRTACSGYLD